MGFDGATGAATHLRADDGLIRLTEYHDGGDADGLVKTESVRRGTGGESRTLRSLEYAARTAGGRTVRPVCRETVYRDATGGGAVSTTFDRTYHPGTVAVATRTARLPPVPESRGGTGAAETVGDAFDEHGHRVWHRDARGFLTRWEYDVPTGAVTRRVDDADAALFDDAPAGWATPAGGGAHLVTDFEHDRLGRTTRTLGPAREAVVGGAAELVRAASWTVYKDWDRETVAASGYRTVADGADVLVNPVSITRRDRNGNVTEEISAVRASAAGRPSAGDTYERSDYVAWTAHEYTDCCKLAAARVYHAIPASGEGRAGAHYDETTFGYDLRDRRNREVSPGGTIAVSVFDARGLATAAYVGTEDAGATADDPTGGGNPGNNMVLVTENLYDGGAGGGDGNLTRVTEFVDDATARVTEYGYDWRNRRVTTAGGEGSFERSFLDDLGRTVRTERRAGGDAGRLLAKSETRYDDRGRTYEALTYPVDPVTGFAGPPVADRTWHDAAGNVIKSLPAGSAAFTRAEYDGLGRETTRYVGYEAGRTGLGSIADATVLTQTETAYDAAGDALRVVNRDRYDDETGTGPLAGPTGAGPNARVTHAATWYDPIGRTLAAADYGTNGGGVLARPAAPPAPSDDVPVSTVEYDGAGRTAATVAPDGLRSEFAYDARGRRTAVVENVAPGSSDADANRTTRFAYTPDGELAALTAENAAAGPQTTAYEYGTTLADSAVASSALLRRVRLPDAAGPADAVTYAYDRQGALAATTDQNGTTHAFEYDGLGRRVADRVDALGAGVDGAVRRVETARDARGLPVRLTTRDAPTGGAVVNEVTREHDAWGRLTREFQSHAGPVTASTPSVRYGYADGSNGALRATSLTYPDGRVLEYGYGPAGSPADATDRVAVLTWDGTVVQEVDRLGSGAAAGLRLPEPGVHRLWKLGGTDPETGDAYGGADRFGREARTRWRNASGTDLVAQDLGHDRAGGRTHRRDLAAGAAGAGRDELYGRDGLRRLETFGRGALNAAGDALAAETFAQAWSLDATGNWAAFIEGPSAASPALEQTRTANAANEIVGIAETAGPAWATPAHDAAGNMTAVPRPADPTGTLAAVYDAWNRPVRLTDGGTVVQKNAYDARGFRVARTEAVGEAKSKRAKPSPKTETRRFFHSAGWQVLEERVGGSSAADRQYVWGTRYVDELVLRDRGAGAGSPYERLYALQDANWNVAAVADASGAVAERYGYAAYGEPQALAPDWTPRPATAFAWETLYAGYRRDPTGLYHVRHRALHPGLGGWLTRDPEEYGDGPSLLEYTSGVPLSKTDPFGLSEWVWPWDPSASWSPADTVGLWKDFDGHTKAILTGDRNPEHNVYAAAVAAAGGEVRCWWDCQVKIHSSIAGAAAPPTGGAATLTFTHFELSKTAAEMGGPKLFGFKDVTTLQSRLSYSLQQRGFGRISQVLRNSANHVSKAPKYAGAGSALAGVSIVEACFSVYCSVKC